MNLSSEQIDRINHAGTAEDALRVSGEIASDYRVRLAYIREVMGPRATGGFFVPTRGNVARKFCEAWRKKQ